MTRVSDPKKKSNYNMKNNTRKTRKPSAWVLGGLTSAMMCLSALGQYATTNSATITINDATPTSATAAAPYPSIIDLTGTSLIGAIEKITVNLVLTHQYTPDVGIILVAPNGEGVVLMNHGGTGNVKNLPLTFDPAGSAIVYGQPLSASTTYLPTDLSGAENFVGAGAAGGPPLTSACVSLAKLASDLGASTNAAGKWRLFVQDDTVQNTGSISSWTLNLYTTPIITSVTTNAVYLAENGAAATLNLSVIDSSPPPAAGFKVTATGPAAGSIVAMPATTFGLSGSVTLTPVANVFGTNTLTINVSDGTVTATTNITVGVAHVEQAPAITLSTNAITLGQGQLSPAVTATLTDVDSSNLTVTVTSSATNIVSPVGVFQTAVAPNVYTVAAGATAALARTSSKGSGLRFWGIKLEPVEAASSRRA